MIKKPAHMYKIKNKRDLAVSIYKLNKNIKNLKLYFICMISLKLGRKNKKYKRNKKNKFLSLILYFIMI